MDWLCDEMLARLARLLRAAGHDTALATPGMPDKALLACARTQGRILLTRDRRLAEAAASQGCLLRGQSVAEQASSLAAVFPVDWLHAPFTRCLIDNTPLRPAPPERMGEIPPGVRDLPNPFTASPVNGCPCCGRLYWPGSHVRRLTASLRRLADGTGPVGRS
ncbi:DUF5615 family PIN-like protein [Azospirillum picis]|uniref:Uncharacterized protein with PIN domain n=1 Tax=Azospirillum picis TaxID=488438 RepID=A0ABU0MRJ2_9PROT|nr:DUF5615 family PIN-like protein [Azospirillum picis]MBP2300830.1 uncharacterized protein with PIN domain [Azospirillum picis]MDQ0536087.1 uncharacterized protein with PIN domain [Azospirillum picis]